MRQILHRPRVTLDLPAERFGDAVAQVDEFMNGLAWRIIAASFRPHHNGGFNGEIEAMILDASPPEGHRWVDSDAWFPAGDRLELTVFGDSIDDVHRQAADFVDSHEYHIHDSTVKHANTDPPRYDAVFGVGLGKRREVSAMRGPGSRGGV